jgi:hypothetical protein
MHANFIATYYVGVVFAWTAACRRQGGLRRQQAKHSTRNGVYQQCAGNWR